LIILVLMQIGGIGFLTGSTLILLAVGRRLGLRERLLLQEALGEGTLSGIGRLVRRIVAFALITEAVGTLLLAVYFWSSRSPASALWFGTFHAIAAFTNAGFDLMGGFRGFSEQQDSPFLLLVLCALVIIGGISYSVVADCWRARGLRQLSVDTRLVLVATAALLAGGTVALLVLERTNPATFGPLSFPQKVLQSFFYSVVSRSAGFSTLPLSGFGDTALLTVIALMFIGGAAGSTTGGIKVNSLAVLAAAVLAAIKGQSRVVVYWREIPTLIVMRALTVGALGMVVIFISAFLLLESTLFRGLLILFEVTSAFGTVGLSTGITPDLGTLDRLVLIATMFVGRLGPLTLAAALAGQDAEGRLQYPATSVRIG
jgi:trk system potassium uptake protein TrkH